MKLTRFGAAALTALAALLLCSCENERVESSDTLRAAIVSPGLLISLPSFLSLPGLLSLIDEPLLIAARQQPSPASAPDQNAAGEIPLPDGPGLDTTKKVCDKCHGSDTWAKHRHTRDEWSAVLDDMTARGMNASDKELDTVLDYLSDRFAPAKKDVPAPPPPPQ